MRASGTAVLTPDAAASARAARMAAVALLARRDYASGELRAKLEQRGFAASAVTDALAELTASRALDDARYTANFVSYHTGRGQGPLRIARELRELGVGTELIDAALAGGPDFHTLAREIRRRKFGAAVPPSWAAKARQARFLQYRGFSSDHIRSALGPDFDPDE